MRFPTFAVDGHINWTITRNTVTVLNQLFLGASGRIFSTSLFFLYFRFEGFESSINVRMKLFHFIAIHLFTN